MENIQEINYNLNYFEVEELKFQSFIEQCQKLIANNNKQMLDNTLKILHFWIKKRKNNDLVNSIQQLQIFDIYKLAQGLIEFQKQWIQSEDQIKNIKSDFKEQFNNQKDVSIKLFNEKIYQLSNDECLKNNLQEISQLKQEIQNLQQTIYENEENQKKVLEEEKNLIKIEYDQNIQTKEEEMNHMKVEYYKQIQTIKEENSYIKAEHEKQIQTIKQEKNLIKIEYDKYIQTKVEEVDHIKAVYDQQIQTIKEENNHIKAEYDKQIQSIKQEKNIIKIEYEKKIQNKEEEVNNIKLEYDKQIEIIMEESNHIKVEYDKLNKYYPQDDYSKFGYDMIILMKSVFDLQNSNPNLQSEAPGLKVQKFNKDFNPELKDVIVVGFQGLRNKGKTFLLNYLINQDFPSNHHVSTPGVCIKEHKVDSKNVAYIDSEGLGNPVSIDYENNHNYQKFISNKRDNDIIDELSQQSLDVDIKNKFYDIKAAEQIQQEFIIQNSNILIIVISQLTLEDQKLIQQISEKFIVDKENRKQRKLIVVHNLQQTHNQNHVKEYIKQLKSNFPIQELQIDSYKQENDEQYYNKVLYDEVKNHIVHVVMAHKDSQAGKYYNKFALYYIKQSISMYLELTHFNIIEKLKKYLNQNLINYVKFKQLQQTDEATQCPDPFMSSILEYSPEAEKIVLNQNVVLEKIRELQVNIFGSLQKECQYSLVCSKQKQDKEIYLFIEIPGKASVKKKYEKKKGLFQLKITQHKETEENEGEILASTRKFEEKLITIPISRDNELWIYQKDKEEAKNGVHKFVFTKEEDEDFE